MNKKEALQFLALVKIAYPTAYRDTDDTTAMATANMWQMSFTDVPYPIMEQAFNHFRMVSKFPPTAAEMVEELRRIYFDALEGAMVSKALGQGERLNQFRAIMECTARYKDNANLGKLNIDTLPRIGGGEYVGLPGTSGNRLD